MKTKTFETLGIWLANVILGASLVLGQIIS